MAVAPTYGIARSHDYGAVSAANTNRDGTGTIVTIATGVAAGTRVVEVAAQATVTTTAGMVRLYLSTDSGSSWKLFDELPVAAVTVSASQNGYRVSKEYKNLVLYGTTRMLGASTHNAEAFSVFAHCQDLT